MRSRSSLLLFLPLFLFSIASNAFAQSLHQQACGAPPTILQSTQPNIFSEQQEQWLGEAMADYIESADHPVKNPEENTYLKTIGDRLLAVLPPTKIQFHFALVESPEVNGFSLAGGRVYLTRKLVASARSEDEVASVIGHEMGHILSHQFAIETTADLRRLLGVTSVSDRADIYTKFQRLTDARLHDKHAINPDSDDKQDEADRVAVYAAAAAGYRPQAYAEFWDRSFFVGGKTGGAISDLFLRTTPSQKRLRRLRGIVAQLPSGCAAVADTSSIAFQHWHTLVLEDQVAAAPAAPAVTVAAVKTAPIELTPPLHLDIERLRFSRDGQYILAQDESSIFVFSRNPFQELFRIDAENALPADFTPDSKQLAFHTPNLHVELWSIAEQRLVSAHEIVAKDNCFQTLLSPDGRTLVCFAYPAEARNIKVQLIDVETGHVVYEKKDWFEPDFNFQVAIIVRALEKDPAGVVAYGFSADGNTLLLGPGVFRLAFDLRTRDPIKISGVLTNYNFQVSYCFQGNDKVIAVSDHNPADSGIFNFPDGKRLESLKLGLSFMHATTGGEYVITNVHKGAAVEVVDMKASKFVFASRNPAVDIIGDSVVNQNLDGSLYLAKFGGPALANIVHTNIPLSPLPPARSAALSPDGRYLALSARTRGAVWDLVSGKQIFLVTGFRSSWWTPEGKLFVEFTEIDKEHPKRIAELTPEPRAGRDLSYKLPEQAYMENNRIFEWNQNKKAWTFTAYSPADLSVKWVRQFPDGHPGYTTNYGDTNLIFSDLLQSSAAKEKLRGNPNLKEQADAVKQKAAGRVIEVVNGDDGTVLAQVVVEVPLTYVGVGGFSKVGDLLYLSTGDNRIIVYSLKTGAQLRQLYGSVVAVDSASETICTINRRDEATVFDKAGVELRHLTLGSPLRFAELRDKGTNLLVVTADQRLYRYSIQTGSLQNETHVSTALNVE